MKIAYFHELPEGGALRSVIEYGKELKKEHSIDLYYVDEKAEKKMNEVFNEVYFFDFKPRGWKGHDWKSKLYKDSIELFNVYILHKQIAKKIDKKNMISF